MQYLYVGKIVNTHALKGEVRILSDFEFKDRVFILNNTLFIGQDKSKEIIETYRKHKQYDMIKFKDINHILDAVKYKGCNVYIQKDSLVLLNDEILIEELTDYNIYSCEKLIGKVEEYRCDNGNKLLRVNNKLIPFNKNFIIKIDKQNKNIYFKNIEVFL